MGGAPAGDGGRPGGAADQRRGQGAPAGRAARVGRLRGPVPDERRPGPAAAPGAGGEAHPPVALPPAGQGPPAGRGPVRRLPHPAGDLPRLPAGRDGPGRADGGARPHPGGGDRDHGAGVRGPLAGGIRAGLPHGHAVRLRVRRPPRGEAARRALPQSVPAGRPAAGRHAGRRAQAGRRGRGDGPRLAHRPRAAGPQRRGAGAAAVRAGRPLGRGDRGPLPGAGWGVGRVGRRAGWPGRARGGQLPGVDARPGRRRADRAPADGQRGVGGAALGARRAPGRDRRPPGAAPAGAAPAPGAQTARRRRPIWPGATGWRRRRSRRPCAPWG